MVDIRAQGPQGTPRDLRSSVSGALHTTSPVLRYLGREQTSGTGTLSLTPVPGATHAYVQVTDADIFFTLDFTTPTDTVGIEAIVGDDIYLEGVSELAGFRAARQGDQTTPNLKLFYMREEAYDL